MRDARQIEAELAKIPHTPECRGDRLTLLGELSRAHDQDDMPESAKGVARMLAEEVKGTRLAAPAWEYVT